MGVVKYGGGLDQIIGKVGGHVFQVSGQSKSIRVLNPIQPVQAKPSQAARLAMHTLSTWWRALSSGQQSSFANAAPSFPTTDRFGNAIVLNGWQLFMLINKRMAFTAQPHITDCQNYSVANAANINDIGFDGTNSHWYLQFNGAQPSYQVLFVYIMFSSTYYKNPSISHKRIFGAFASHGSGLYDMWPLLTPYEITRFNAGHPHNLMQFVVMTNNNALCQYTHILAP